MALPAPLPPTALFTACDPAGLGFETTETVEEIRQMVGQDRAVDAIRLGATMPMEGYNLFVLGPSGSGRHSFVRQFLAQQAAERPAAPDWCYVNNFEESHKPRALRLPAGRGVKLRDDVRKLIDEVLTTIPAAFEGDDYRTRRQTLERGFQEEQSQAFEAVQHYAEERGIRVIQTPTGFAFAPVRDGEVVGPEEFQRLPEETRKRIEADVEELGKQLQKAMEGTPRRVRKLRERLRELDREVAVFAVGSLVDDLLARYQDLPEVAAYVEAMRADIIEHVELFRATGDQRGAPAIPGGGEQQVTADGVARRYTVNLLVSNADAEGAPVVVEDHPAYNHLVGKIEHLAQFGTLVTDFHLIKPGALHRANHGYLVLDAHKVLTEPFAWTALKEALKSRCARIESLGQAYSLVSTVSLEPEAVPLDLKVVLIGERIVYYLLENLDPEFPELFKIAADFDDRMPRTPENERLMAQLLGTIARRDGLLPLDARAVARVIEESARDAGDSQRISASVRRAADVVREAHAIAAAAGAERVRAEDVDGAIAARTRRHARIRDRMQEAVLRGTILIDTDGERVGQINGLAVSQVGQLAFGHPSRISARVTVGSGKVVDIEREVELGGPLHSKGVLILAGFLASHYAPDEPLSLAATLVFEQSYGGVDGDSASSTELYALLSAIAGIPIRQRFAVTGSVNQFGDVQAIGGVNEKIEGFFDICRARGLTGEQGVLIPRSNVEHLMLRRDVVEAVERGEFAVYAVGHVDEGIAILTGLEPGARGDDGEYPEGSFHRRVRDRLRELAQRRREFAQKGEDRQ
ncbi:MAG: AAA family ATPase [Ectothiorhodospiraceae bacterium]|nr:AAA family ATPase [Chromatiales bacterium]MCP5157098.1 AAA family ATPase [Ectothiorhodospiraceae bacterium]